jgi:hypothetical protein
MSSGLFASNQAQDEAHNDTGHKTKSRRRNYDEYRPSVGVGSNPPHHCDAQDETSRDGKSVGFQDRPPERSATNSYTSELRAIGTDRAL